MHMNAETHTNSTKYAHHDDGIVIKKNFLNTRVLFCDQTHETLKKSIFNISIAHDVETVKPTGFKDKCKREKAGWSGDASVCVHLRTTWKGKYCLHFRDKGGWHMCGRSISLCHCDTPGGRRNLVCLPHKVRLSLDRFIRRVFFGLHDA